jgi:hypothetical protein
LLSVVRLLRGLRVTLGHLVTPFERRKARSSAHLTPRNLG